MSYFEINQIKREVKALRGEMNRLERLISNSTKPVYIDLNMASRLYGFDANTLRHWANTGKLDGVASKVVGKWVVHVERLESWMKGGDNGMS